MDQDTFKKFVKKYIDNDDKLKDLNKSLKDLKLEKKEYETKILEYMINNDLDEVELGGGKLKKTVSKSYVPIKKEHITTKLSEKLDNEKAKEIAEHIVNNREFNEISKIKRT